MKIITLITKLQKLANKNPNLKILLASDTEGNGYSPLNEIAYCPKDYFYNFETREFWEENSLPLKGFEEVVILYP